jgi:hypothetical protein
MISRRIQIGAVGAVGLWGALGFNRGLQHHDYIHKENIETYRQKMARHEREVERYDADKLKYPTIHFNKPSDPPTKPTKYVLSSVAYGFYGSFCYINPVFTPVYFAKECYRFETFIRGFDGEKTKKYYQTLEIFD